MNLIEQKKSKLDLKEDYHDPGRSVYKYKSGVDRNEFWRGGGVPGNKITNVLLLQPSNGNGTGQIGFKEDKFTRSVINEPETTWGCQAINPINMTRLRMGRNERGQIKTPETPVIASHLKKKD